LCLLKYGYSLTFRSERSLTNQGPGVDRGTFVKASCSAASPPRKLRRACEPISLINETANEREAHFGGLFKVTSDAGRRLGSNIRLNAEFDSQLYNKIIVLV
jgi:hypothetical protein